MSINLINYALAKKDWKKAYEDLKVLGVGGRNYLRELGGESYNINRIYAVDRTGSTIVTINNKKWIRYTGRSIFRLASVPVDPNTEYTYSFTVYATNNPRTVRLAFYSEGEYGRKYVDITTTPVRVYVTGITKETATTDILHVLDLDSTDIYYFADFKLEKGNKATDWTPAPEDIDAHPFVVELAETVYRSKQNEERIRNLENAITALGLEEKSISN